MSGNLIALTDPLRVVQGDAGEVCVQCLEYLGMSGNLIALREMLGSVGGLSGKNKAYCVWAVHASRHV